MRERGSAVFENSELMFLHGLIVSAEEEKLLQDKMPQHLSKSEATNREILEIIGQIANSQKQLNMLSVNARIEAARSRQVGLGFAVVADRIKAFSTQNSLWANVISKALCAEAA